MKGKQFFSLTTESSAKIWRQHNAFKPLDGLGCCPFLCSGSVVVVDLMFYVPPIVRGVLC